MTNRILVIGAGHGGLVAGAHLAQNGFDVTVFEKNSEDNMGYEWQDDFMLSVFNEVGIEEPNPDTYSHKQNVTFYTPDLQTKLTTGIPEKEREIAFNRQQLYKILINFARQSGVKFQFKTKVESPIIKNEIIIGVIVNNKEVYGDLIIDSAGFHTPIRPKLPDTYKIKKNLNRGEFIKTYRGFFDINQTNPIPSQLSDFFNVYVGFNDVCLLGWYRIFENKSDVLFGKLDPFEEDESQELLGKLREQAPCLGKTEMIKSKIIDIPLRRTLNRIIGPNYVALGDSACMTIPILGSGIENAMLAGKYLADILIKINQKQTSHDMIHYSTEDLWPFQVQYFQKIGANMASIDYLKNYLLTTPWTDINFLFEKGLIKIRDLEAGSTGKDIKLSLLDLLGRISRGISRLGLLIKLKISVDKIAKVKKLTKKIPIIYNEENIGKWVDKLDKFFYKFENQLGIITTKKLGTI